MTQSIRAIYDAILAAAKRDELIVIEPEAGSTEAAMLCAVSMESLDITPLAVIYGDESRKSESDCFTAEDDAFLHSMGIKPSRLLIPALPASEQTNPLRHVIP
jgi:hypothetical protein